MRIKLAVDIPKLYVPPGRRATAEAAMAERACDGGFQSTPLQRAARHGDTSLVAVALECSATNLDAVDAEGRTALMIAAANGHAAVVRALLDAGCDVDAVDGAGMSAVDAARAAGHAAIAASVQTEKAKREALLSQICGKQGLPPELAALLSAGGPPGAGRSAEAPF